MEDRREDKHLDDPPTICDNCSADIFVSELMPCEACGAEFCIDCHFPDVHGCGEDDQN